jgi:hypothetical protein
VHVRPANVPAVLDPRAAVFGAGQYAGGRQTGQIQAGTWYRPVAANFTDADSNESAATVRRGSGCCREQRGG